MRIHAILILAAAPLAACASTGDMVSTDPFAYRALSQNDYARAEATLVVAQAKTPDEPSMLINLATVYGRTGRPDAATRLLSKVLAQPNILLDVSNAKTEWSHDLARRGLEQRAGVTTR